MATLFPNNGNDPYVFNDHSPDTTQANLDLHSGAFNTADISSAVPAGATTIFLTFVVFAYPNAANSSVAPPQVPTVEVLNQGSASDGPGTILNLAGGSSSVTYAPGQFVNYTYASLGGGLFQAIFTFDNIALDSLVPWNIRFTVTDGVTSAANQVGLTFVVDVADTRAPWLAVPGQGFLTAAGPLPIDFGAALLNTFTLAGPSGANAKQILVGKTEPLSVPVGNYGIAPLTVNAVNAGASGFSMSIAGSSVIIPPGSSDLTSVSAVLTATVPTPKAGPPVVQFQLGSTDTAAAITGPHFNTVSLKAQAGDLETVFVLDFSGSMSANDAGGSPRYVALREAFTQAMTSLISFAGGTPQNTFGIVVYPNPAGGASSNGEQLTKTVLPLTSANLTTAQGLLAPLTPTDSTPMAGITTNKGGIYQAAGGSAPDPTACGLFLPNSTDGFFSNFRWMILMSDGFSNVGDDPETTITSTYFNTLKVSAITVGFGLPGAGALGVGELQAIASAGRGASTTPAYFGAQPSGAVSQQITMGFEKAVAEVLKLDFAADPDATLLPGTAENRHSVIITEYDSRASFVVGCGSARDGEIIQVQLISPLGEAITPSTVGNFGMTFNQTAFSKAFYASPLTFAPRGGSHRYGKWTIVVSRATDFGVPVASLSAAGLQYAYHVGVDSRLSLSVSSTNPVNYAGNGISITAALSLQGRPVSGAHVTAVIAGSGQGFDNWLASQTITQAEYDAALKSLQAQGLQDIQALFVKTTALAAKGIVFPGLGSSVVQTLSQEQTHGTYRTTFSSTTQPGTYKFLVSATGQDDKGNSFTRQQTWTTVVTVLPDAASTLVSITYQVVAGQMQATLWVRPQDRFGNVFLTDPAISKAIQVLLAGGAVPSGPLKWNLDASYSQMFTYPLTATPVISIVVGGHVIGPKITPPVFGKLLFVNQVVRFTKGREAKPGENHHTDPSQALGDPSRKPLTDFVALGGLGQAAFDVKGQVIHAKEVTVFVGLDTSLRAYALDVLPVQAGVGWVEIGRSRGVTETFSLVPKKRVPVDAKGWYIEVEGRLAGETFDVKIPLEGKLHAPVDPLSRIGSKGIVEMRVRDLSNQVANPDGTPSESPGVSILGIGFAS